MGTTIEIQSRETPPQSLRNGSFSFESSQSAAPFFPYTDEQLDTALATFGTGIAGQYARQTIEAGNTCEKKLDGGSRCHAQAVGTIEFELVLTGLELLSCREHIKDMHREISASLIENGKNPSSVITINGHGRG